MREEYDFSDGVKNPSAARLKRRKKRTTINIDLAAIEFFKAESEQTGIPYRTLIN